MKKIQTLAMITRDNEILLGMKKRGFGAGMWNGFGGKLKENETIEQALSRELLEESSLTAEKIEKRGILTFLFENEEIEVHIFKILNHSGSPRESEEMLPKWFNLSDIPYNSMWSDDKHWLPLFLQNKKFIGTFNFNNSGAIESFNLKETPDLY